MRVLVCGSRDFADYEKVTAVLSLFRDVDNVMVIQGGAAGADRMAGHAAAQLGYGVTTYAALWETYGKRAGFVRNQQMLDSGVDLMIAFKSSATSRGTDDMIGRCKAAGIRGYVFTSLKGGS